MRKVILAPMLVLAILLLTSSLHFTAINGDGESESYVVLEDHSFILSVVNSAGGRAVIYQFATQIEADLEGIAMDSSGNYIVTMFHANTLSKIMPDGVMTVIYTFPADSGPGRFAIDSSGNYIVAEWGADILSKITPAGERTVIYTFPATSGPNSVAIDSSGNYIVTEGDEANILSKITPAGERTVIYTFTYGTGPYKVRIDSSGNYIVCEPWTEVLSKITPAGERTVIYNFTHHTWPASFAIDSSGNYIVAEAVSHTLSKVTPDGQRTVIYKWPSETYTEPWDVCLYVSSVPQLLFADITQNGLTATWTQSADPFFTGYQLYQSSTQGDLGSLIGTNTNVADTSLAVTGLSPGTTYYFTLRILEANGLHVDSGQLSIMTAKAFWQERWFPYVVFFAVLIGVAAIVIYILAIKYRKRTHVTWSAEEGRDDRSTQKERRSER